MVKENDRFPYYETTMLTMNSMKRGPDKKFSISTSCIEVSKIMKKCPYKCTLIERNNHDRYEFNIVHRAGKNEISQIEEWIKNNVDTFIWRNLSKLTKMEEFANEGRGSKSKDEIVVYNIFKSKGIVPMWQYKIGHRIADFVFEKERMVVELDGYCHKCTIKKDVKRDRYYKKRGWSIVRICYEDFDEEILNHKIEDAVEDICRTITEIRKRMKESKSTL